MMLVLVEKDDVGAQGAREVLLLGLALGMPERTLGLLAASPAVRAPLGLPSVKGMSQTTGRVMLLRVDAQEVVPLVLRP